ncbi:hypothetical protein [Spirulina sp. 06S082]|nr:hypothetical protein [Spirulina sp. 06S082]MEA5471840.1 hypothetical protein [Spirulina sp. 06S082]
MGTVFAEIGGRGRITVTSRDGIVAEAKVERKVRKEDLLRVL